MRKVAALGAVSVLVLGAHDALALPRNPVLLRLGGHPQPVRTPLQRLTSQLLKTQVLRQSAARPQTASSHEVVLSSLEAGIVAGINRQRVMRGLHPLRVSRGLTAAASYHCRQMGLFGFFEHESRNGAPFWRRIERFYPSSRHGYWSVGENILWESPDTNPGSAVHDWMVSPPHRENILTREFRDIGVAAVHFASAPGTFQGQPVTIVTADFGVRR